MPEGSLERLAQLQPGDIAVAPIRDQTRNQDVPAKLLRGAFANALIERLYSPLDLEYVDVNWVESSFRGTPAPDALLVVAVTNWDPSHIYSNGDVTGEAEVLLFEGGDTSESPLWRDFVRATVHLGDSQGNPPSPSDHLIGNAALLFARAALAGLPPRDPVAAHP